MDDDSCGKFYCVYFDNQRYWGILQHVFADDEDDDVNSVEISFLHYKYDDIWDYPKRKDIQMVKPKFILLGPSVPALENMALDF